MIRALLFDMGGTLDANGVGWLDRFESAYGAAGVALTRATLQAAFDHAERCAAVDEIIGAARLDAMVDRHVGWQLEHLACDPAFAEWTEHAGTHAIARLGVEVVNGFVDPIRRTAARNAGLLADLKLRGFRLGVVSNGCGNVAVLCDDLGYTPFLSVIVDSRLVGLHKPDPSIYMYAAARLGLPPSAIMMIGDSFERDIRPAASIGMRTAWLQGDRGLQCPDSSLVDACLRALSELLRALQAGVPTVA